MIVRKTIEKRMVYKLSGYRIGDIEICNLEPGVLIQESGARAEQYYFVIRNDDTRGNPESLTVVTYAYGENERGYADTETINYNAFRQYLLKHFDKREADSIDTITKKMLE